MLEQVQVRRSEVAQKLLKVRSDEEDRKLQIQEQEKKKQKVEETIGSLLERADELEEGIRAASDETARLNKNLNNTQQEYHKFSTRLESLRNLAERYEGYGNSIRKVMEVRDRVRGIHGVVADLLDVPKEYETAIETALGGSIQNIVTDSEQTAKILIEHLKKNQYGRATFLPLSAISAKSGFDQKQALKEPGAIGLASSLVKADSRYAGLVEYLLGRVLVADNIDSAIAIARRYRHSFRIVTPSGELLSPGGSMSGGAFRNSSNLLGRKREMEELEGQCTKALVQVDRIQKELVLQEGIRQEKTEELEQVKAELQACYLEENTVEMELRQLEKSQSELLDSSADMNMENRQLEGQMRDIRTELETIAEKIRELEAIDSRKNQEIAGYSAQLDEAKEKGRKRFTDFRRSSCRLLP